MHPLIRKYKPYLLRLKRKFNRTTKFDFRPYPSDEFRKKILLINHLKINILLDVGANIGQFGSEMRASGYKGWIYSFEPVDEAFQALSKMASKDTKWKVFHYALGAENSTHKIQLTENLVSSSLLEPKQELLDMEASTKVIDTQEIQVKKLDDVYSELKLDKDSVFLKMDVQGFESEVLKGGAQSLPKIKLIQMEMPLIKTYEGGKDFYELDKLMRENHYKLVNIDSGYYDSQTGLGVEVDGTYQNTRLAD